MKIRKTSVPGDALISGFMPADYADAFACETTLPGDVTPDRVQKAFWVTCQRWVRGLMKLRNTVMRLLGVDSGDEIARHIEQCIDTGRPSGMVGMPARSDSETVLRVEDKHLMFFLSVRIEPTGGSRKIVTVTTVVNFNNRFGRVYFAIIRPFHFAVVRATLGRVLKVLGGDQS